MDNLAHEILLKAGRGLLDLDGKTVDSSIRHSIEKKLVNQAKSVGHSQEVGVMNEQAAADLGVRTKRKGNLVGWAVRKLHQGFYLARYGWDFDVSPKRCFAYVDGAGSLECAKVRCEDGTTQLLRLTWQDVSVADWYIPENLELTR